MMRSICLDARRSDSARAPSPELASRKPTKRFQFLPNKPNFCSWPGRAHIGGANHHVGTLPAPNGPVPAEGVQS